MSVDLHGYSVHDAWKEYRRITQECYWKNIKYIVIITGIGAMNTEFFHWSNSDPFVSHIEQLNEGAWKVFMKKKPTIAAVERKKELDLNPLLKKFQK